MQDEEFLDEWNIGGNNDQEDEEIGGQEQDNEQAENVRDA